MLPVSNSWNSLFYRSVLNEAIIKFVIEDYGTLYREDIFSYEFRGRNRYLCDEYPSYEATIEAVMRNDFLNFANFIGKSVEIYYGFIINGSDEYVKALTLFIDDIEINDNGRIATFSLKSIFAYMTKTISMELYQQIGTDAPTYSNTFSSFLSSQLTNYQYTKLSSQNGNIRFLPSKISLGEALQNLVFVNRNYMKLLSDNTIYINEEIASANEVRFSDLNIIDYPHYSKIEQPSDVVVSYFNPLASTNSTINVCEETMIISGSQQHQGSFTTEYDNQNAFIYWQACKRSRLTSQNTNIYNERLVVSNDEIFVSGGADVDVNYDFAVNGYSFHNFYNVENNKVAIFDINITSPSDVEYRVSSYLTSQKEVELSLRINPAFELLDKIYFKSGYEFMIIEEMTITYKGSYRGRIKGIYYDEVEQPIISNISITSNQFSMNIENRNDVKCEAVFFAEDTRLYASSDYHVMVDANTTIAYKERTQLALFNIIYSYVRQKRNGTLAVDVYVAFKYGLYTSSKVLVLEKDV
jgi:hypothetical protein